MSLILILSTENLSTDAINVIIQSVDALRHIRVFTNNKTIH
jgi:hypothetical protein